MPVRLGQIYVEIAADTDKLESGVKESRRELGSLEDSMTRAGVKSQLFTAALDVAGRAALALGREIIALARTGIDLIETQNKFNTVFSESSKAVTTLAANFGILSKGEAQGFLATTGAILRGAGVTGDELDTLSARVGELARDFSSFNNVPVAETFAAISSAITGEREQLKRLGIVVQEAEVQQAALAASGKATAKELTQQEKATATLELITKKAGVQIGDYARTSDSAANQIKSLQTTVQNAREEIATRMTPSVERLIGSVVKLANSDGAKKMLDVLASTAEDAAASVAGAAEKMSDAFSRNESIIVGAAESIGKELESLITLFDIVAAGGIDKYFAQKKSQSRGERSTDAAIERFLNTRVDQQEQKILENGGAPLSPSEREALLQKARLNLYTPKNPAANDPLNPRVINPIRPESITVGGDGAGGGGSVEVQKTIDELIKEQNAKLVERQQLELAILDIQNKMIVAEQARYDWSDYVRDGIAEELGLRRDVVDKMIDGVEPINAQADLQNRITDAARLTKEEIAEMNEHLSVAQDLTAGIETNMSQFEVDVANAFNYSEAFADTIANAGVTLLDVTQPLEERLRKIGNMVKDLILDIAQAILKTQILKLLAGGGGIGAAIALGAVGVGLIAGGIASAERSKPRPADLSRQIGGSRYTQDPKTGVWQPTNKSIGDAPKLVASIGIDSLNIALERHKKQTSVV